MQRRPGRRLWGPPIPPRRTDRVEDLSAWLLVTLGLLAVLGAVVVGRGAHDAALRGVGTASPLRVTLLADAPEAPIGRPVQPPLPPVPVTWTTTDGEEETGELAVQAPLRVGATVTAWVDGDGQLTPSPPRHAAEAMAFGIGAALTVAALAWALLAASWAALHRLTAARNDASWAREWARVEPVWRRQVI